MDYFIKIWFAIWGYVHIPFGLPHVRYQEYVWVGCFALRTGCCWQPQLKRTVYYLHHMKKIHLLSYYADFPRL